MTEGQIRYQTIMENQRHNQMMERLGAQELAVKQQQADTAARQAEISQQQADTAKEAERRKSLERFDSNLWSGVESWNKSVGNAINFIKLFTGASLFK